MKLAAVVAAIMLIACSAEPAVPRTQPVSTTAATTRPAAATAATDTKMEQSTAEAPLPPALDPTEAQTAPAPAAPTPETTTTHTDAPEPQTDTPEAAPTAIHTREIVLLKVAVAEIPSGLPDYDSHDWKHWTDGDCQDAHQEVLVAESRSTVSYRTDR